MMRLRTHRRYARGLTLMECLMASVVLAVAAVAGAQAVWTGQMATYEAIHRQQAMSLAEAMLEEILSKPYDAAGAATPGPGGLTNRTSFAYIDDYHGFTENPGNVRDAGGTLYPSDYQGFTRRVTMAYTSVSVTGFSAAVTGLNISVTVTDQDGLSWSLTRFVSDP